MSADEAPARARLTLRLRRGIRWRKDIWKLEEKPTGRGKVRREFPRDRLGMMGVTWRGYYDSFGLLRYHSLIPYSDPPLGH